MWRCLAQAKDWLLLKQEALEAQFRPSDADRLETFFRLLCNLADLSADDGACVLDSETVDPDTLKLIQERLAFLLLSSAEGNDERQRTLLERFPNVFSLRRTEE